MNRKFLDSLFRVKPMISHFPDNGGTDDTDDTKNDGSSSGFNIDEIVKALDEKGYSLVKKEELEEMNNTLKTFKNGQNGQNNGQNGQNNGQNGQNGQNNGQNGQNDNQQSNVLMSAMLNEIKGLKTEINNIQTNVINNISVKNQLDQLLGDIPEGNLDIAKALINNMNPTDAIKQINDLNLTVPRNGAYNSSRSIELQKSEAQKYANTDIGKQLGLTATDYENGMNNGADIMNRMEQAFAQTELVGVNGVADILRNFNKGGK